MFADFILKWFTLYYLILGILFFFSGIALMIKTNRATNYLHAQAQNKQPPALPRAILKYFFFFTIPCLIFSCMLFSWTELLFSLWSLLIIYIAGIQLVRWPQTRQTIKNHREQIRRIIRMTGAIMLAVSPVIFLLGYFVIQKII